MNPTELRMRRLNVAAFIRADPVDIIITRPGEPTRSAAGGLVPGEASTLDSQQARIVQSKRRYDTGLINSEVGEIPRTQYLLIGRFDIDVKVDDKFTWLGKTYLILGIHPTRTESTVCAIDFEGAANRG